MISEDDYKKVLSSLQALCARREYCPSEIRQKALLRLRSLLQEEERDSIGTIADRMTEELTAEGFVDSLRYARAFASEKSSLQGWGPYKISQALLAKQIDRQKLPLFNALHNGTEILRCLCKWVYVCHNSTIYKIR